MEGLGSGLVDVILSSASLVSLFTEEVDCTGGIHWFLCAYTRDLLGNYVCNHIRKRASCSLGMDVEVVKSER